MKETINRGCPMCDKWRSRVFDRLSYSAWDAKADKWFAKGRRQRWCNNCQHWRWMKTGSTGTKGNT